MKKIQVECDSYVQGAFNMPIQYEVDGEVKEVIVRIVSPNNYQI